MDSQPSLTSTGPESSRSAKNRVVVPTARFAFAAFPWSWCTGSGLRHLQGQTLVCCCGCQTPKGTPLYLCFVTTRLTLPKKGSHDPGSRSRSVSLPGGVMFQGLSYRLDLPGRLTSTPWQFSSPITTVQRPKRATRSLYRAYKIYCKQGCCWIKVCKISCLLAGVTLIRVK